VIKALANRPFDLKDGIAYFVPEKELECNQEYAKRVIEGRWIERNWREHTGRPNVLAVYAAERMASMGGTILEIGAGTGAGFVYYLLNRDRDARLIISDLSPTVVREWKALFKRGMRPPNVEYAALDICDLPFKDNSLDFVSGYGEYGNIKGDKVKALSEIYRVIKPGGMYVMGVICVNSEHAKTLPKKAFDVLTDKFPALFMDYYQESLGAGFTHIESEQGGSWSNENNDGELAGLCRELNIHLVFSTYLRFCRKGDN